LKYDWGVLSEQGLKPHGILADTMVAAYVLDPEGRHNLETLAGRYLNYTVMTYEQLCGKGKDQIPFDLIPIAQATRYSAEDAVIALRLWHQLKGQLEAQSLTHVFEKVDLPLVEVLSRIELAGVCIDVNHLHALSKRFEGELREIESRVGAYV